MWLNPQDLWLYEHARGGTDAAPTSLARAQHVLQAGDEVAILPNPLGRADVVPAFTPSWNTNVWPLLIDANNITVKFSVVPERGDTVDYAVSIGTPENVPIGSGSYAISHSFGATAVILVTPSWNTSVYRITKTATTLTVGFGTEAPVHSFIHWGLFDDSDDLVATDTVSADSNTYTIQHDGGRAFLPGFFLPNWNTTIRFVDKLDANQTIISFSTPPFSSASLDRRIKYV